MTGLTGSGPRRGLIPQGTTELLAPARDLEGALAAINCGADAVYVGADRFGAREAAGNRMDDIASLVAYAHRYWARVYVTINTLLTDPELDDVQRLAWSLHEIDIDGLIIQDVGLLECALPPLPLIASTQMHNNTLEKVAFLEQVGFSRAILARELTLDEIRAVRRAAPSIELECFVHGALCVCYSGQCYLSLALGGRSGNRGQCAQPCRKPYRLEDAYGRVVHEGQHLLSLHDLNLSEDLPALLDAGVTSFKIEGRLKDRAYVANVVAHYRERLDGALHGRGLHRSSSGTSRAGFTPNPDRTFNRGYTRYFLHGRAERIGGTTTPKMIGEEIGRVTRLSGSEITIATRTDFTPGDGLCYFDRDGNLQGTPVNAVNGETVSVQNARGIRPGVTIYRNHDHAFLSAVDSARSERRISITLRLRTTLDGVTLVATDEDGVQVEHHLSRCLEPAREPEAALATIHRQLARTGQSMYECSAVVVEISPVPFFPVSVLNGLRRETLDRLTTERERHRPRVTGGAIQNDVPYPAHALTYLGNILNKKAEVFYRRHGVATIEPAAESGVDLRGRKVMTTRYCLMHQLDLCRKPGVDGSVEQPLYLVDDEGNRLRLDFDCGRCEMHVVLE